MKLSKKPTNHILVKAETNSEWDNCDYAIINVSKSWIESLQSRLNALRKIQDEKDFFTIKFFDRNVKFYSSNEELTILKEIKEKSFAFVQMDNQEEFSEPENILDAYCISFYSNGVGKYTAYGKHTGEEFFTENIPFADIVSLCTD